MDPQTVIAVLALHILMSGFLLFMVGRSLPDGGGLRLFATGALLFGSAYVLRMLLGLASAHPVAALMDAMMVLALLLFWVGIRGFFGRPTWPWRRTVLVAAGFGMLQAVAQEQGGPLARHVMLNATLGAQYLLLAGAAAWPMRVLRAGRPRPAAATGGAPADGSDLPERTPAMLLSAMIGLLGAATLVRSAYVAASGTETLYRGLFAQTYYGLSSLVALALCPLVLWMTFRRLARQLAELATRDALTRVLNRNGLEEALRRHFGRRGDATLAWLVADLDHFKRVNDTLGHAAGDALLRGVAGTLMQHVRAGDFVGRTGGEEFLVGCSEADEWKLAALAERLRAAVEALEVRVPNSPGAVRCTVSIGVSRPFYRQADWEDAVREADAALYRAKAGGRNRVEVAAGATGA